MIRFTHKGNFANAEKFLKKNQHQTFTNLIERYANQGLQALRANTPKDSGLTTDSWAYEISHSNHGFRISWTNNNIVDGIPVAILIQYGHGTRSGSFVEGRDFINPAMKPIFEQLAENLWKEVTSL